MMVSGARIALPLVIVAFITQLSFGMMTKVDTQMNVWGVGFSFTIAFGCIALSTFIPTFVSESNVLLDKAVSSLSELVGVRL